MGKRRWFRFFAADSAAACGCRVADLACPCGYDFDVDDVVVSRGRRDDCEAVYCSVACGALEERVCEQIAKKLLGVA